MLKKNNIEYMSDASFYVNDYNFNKEKNSCFDQLSLDSNSGIGNVIEINPCQGLFVSCADWIPKIDMERKYNIEKKFLKIYFLELGEIYLIQNGIKTKKITKGINLYQNKPNYGRVLYKKDIPIKYISILLFDSFIENNILAKISHDKNEFEQVFFIEKPNYNKKEIALIFMQLKEKIINGFESSLYYESKINEIVSIILEANKNKIPIISNVKLNIVPRDFKKIDNFYRSIRNNPCSIPTMEQMCKDSAMGETKLRKTFKTLYGTTLGEFIQKCKIEYSLSLLANKQLSISEISHTLGYNNQSKFAKSFRKYYELNPNEYRNKYYP